MSVLTRGKMAGEKFLDDIIFLLKEQWIPATGGKVPIIRRESQVKAVGVGSSKYNEIIVSLDSENIKEFGMLKGDTTDWRKFERDWYHDISVTIDLRSGVSLVRMEQMVSECIAILKSRTVPIIDNTQYVHLRVTTATSKNEEYRNLFRYLIDVSVGIENP